MTEPSVVSNQWKHTTSCIYDLICSFWFLVIRLATITPNVMLAVVNLQKINWAGLELKETWAIGVGARLAQREI